jgi:hypothetical protein
VGHVARVGEKKNAYTVLVGNSEKLRPLGNLDVGERIILNCII